METIKKKLNPRMTSLKCGTCSHAMFHQLNYEFDNVKPNEEKASDIFAGGVAHKGHQCGLVLGGALAVGTEAYRKYDDKNKSIAMAINASKLLVNSFQKRTNKVNCIDILKVDWDNKFDTSFLKLKIIGQGIVFSPCFNLMAKWTPDAVQAAKNGFSESINYSQPCISCSTEVVKKMGGTEEESIMAAGFAGGFGLSGNTCGAVADAIWYKMLEWVKNNPTKKPSLFNNPIAENVLSAFYMQTDSEILCNKICSRSFNTIDEHSDYIKTGGCSNLIETLAKS
jgi:C_GCAxxG_C_C family probable redox protein